MRSVSRRRGNVLDERRVQNSVILPLCACGRAGCASGGHRGERCIPRHDWQGAGGGRGDQWNPCCGSCTNGRLCCLHGERHTLRTAQGGLEVRACVSLSLSLSPWLSLWLSPCVLLTYLISPHSHRPLTLAGTVSAQPLPQTTPPSQTYPFAPCPPSSPWACPDTWRLSPHTPLTTRTLSGAWRARARTCLPTSSIRLCSACNPQVRVPCVHCVHCVHSKCLPS